jgi:hypothetical protein
VSTAISQTHFKKPRTFKPDSISSQQVLTLALYLNDFDRFLISKSDRLGEDRFDVLYTGLYLNIYYHCCHLCRTCNSVDSLACGDNDLLADSQFQARKSPEQNVLDILTVFSETRHMILHGAMINSR